MESTPNKDAPPSNSKENLSGIEPLDFVAAIVVLKIAKMSNDNIVSFWHFIKFDNFCCSPNQYNHSVNDFLLS